MVSDVASEVEWRDWRERESRFEIANRVETPDAAEDRTIVRETQRETDASERLK